MISLARSKPPICVPFSGASLPDGGAHRQPFAESRLIGAAGISALSAPQVDGVNTLPPGTPAEAGVSISGNTLHFTFALPEGQAGPAGPPFANFIVDSVNTVGPGESAACSVWFDGSNVRFSFSIPRGENGGPGEQGIPGNPGNPGEVTSAALANALSSAVAGTSANSNGVALLLPSQPDPTILDVANKLDELIQALRR